MYHITRSFQRINWRIFDNNPYYLFLFSLLFSLYCLSKLFTSSIDKTGTCLIDVLSFTRFELHSQLFISQPYLRVASLEASTHSLVCLSARLFLSMLIRYVTSFSSLSNLSSRDSMSISIFIIRL